MNRTTSMEIPRLYPVPLEPSNWSGEENNTDSKSKAISDPDAADSAIGYNKPILETDDADLNESEKKKRRLEDSDEIADQGSYMRWVPPSNLPRRSISVARPIAEMKGHTAFLTFAVRPSLVAPIVDNNFVSVLGDEKDDVASTSMTSAELRG